MGAEIDVNFHTIKVEIDVHFYTMEEEIVGFEQWEVGWCEKKLTNYTHFSFFGLRHTKN